MNVDALVSGIAAIIAVFVYLLLGSRLLRRKVSAESLMANVQFASFWIGLAVVTGLGGIESLIAAATLPPLAIVATFEYLEIALLCLALWGLVGYLLYLFLGKHHLLALSSAYGLLYGALLYLITASRPVSVTVSSGTVSLTFATTFSTPLVVLLVVGLLLPELAAAVLYFTLVFRSRDRTVRFRVTLVSWSLIALFGLGFVDIGSALGGGLAAQLFSRSVGVISALVILLAFYPPAAIRRRWGVRGIDDPGAPAP